MLVSLIFLVQPQSNANLLANDCVGTDVIVEMLEQ